MAHRALVAYERDPDRYDVHASRDGGCRLAGSITPEDPFADGAVEADPRVLDCPFDSVVTMVDPVRHEALYRVGPDYGVRLYVPVWLALGHYLGRSADAETAAPGLLVAVDSARAAADLRAWLRAAKGVLADAVAAGAMSLSAAESVLADAVRSRAGGPVHSLGGPNE